MFLIASLRIKVPMNSVEYTLKSKMSRENCLNVQKLSHLSINTMTSKAHALSKETMTSNISTQTVDLAKSA
jgi:hypothetical protein